MITNPTGYNVLEKYNNKSMLPIISVKGISDSAREGLLNAMEYVIMDCNCRQTDVEFDWYYFDDNEHEMEIFGLLIPDDCDYDDDVIRAFIYTNAFSIMGNFLTKPKLTGTIENNHASS